jgi:L-rhamnose mutarotase
MSKVKAKYEQLSHELHKPVTKKFQRRRVTVKRIDEIFGADLVDMNEWKSDNKNVRFILTVIDVFSKFAWAIPVKDKTGVSITNAFKEIFKDRIPEFLWVDEGKEFYNKDLKALLKKHNIEMYSTFGDHKSAVIERFNRTLKTNMWKALTASNASSLKWVDMLPSLVDTYNNKYHRTIKTTPIEASKKKNEDDVMMTINEVKQIKPIQPKCKVGDLVRVSKIKKTFEKGYINNWTREVFKVSEVLKTIPVTYKLVEYDNTSIEGSFYEAEIQKTQTSIIFQLDAVLKSRTRKKVKEHFVHWFGWSDKYDTWITDDQLKLLL